MKKLPPLIMCALASLLATTGAIGHADEQVASEHVAAPPKSLVDKAFAGTLTAEEQTILVRQYPEIAAVVPSQSGPEMVVHAVSPSNESIAPAATTCSTYSGYNTLKSLLGFTIYKFSHEAKVCSNGTKTTSHSSPTYTLSNIDPTVEGWAVTDKSVKGVGTGTSTSRIQVRVSQCIVKYGCYSYHYPTGTIVARANNTASISTTAR